MPYRNFNFFRPWTICGRSSLLRQDSEDSIGGEISHLTTPRTFNSALEGGLCIISYARYFNIAKFFFDFRPLVRKANQDYAVELIATQPISFHDGQDAIRR